MRKLSKYSVGVGDRFAHQAKPQLRAFMQAAKMGVEVTPVWNKSHREHTTVGSMPDSTRRAASAAVSALGFQGAWFVDADHINLQTVDDYTRACDFFTIDVADSIGRAARESDVAAFVKRHADLVGETRLPGMEPVQASEAEVAAIAAHYLLATQKAGEVYRRIMLRKGAGNFLVEVSLDETNQPQSPFELLVILAALADQRIPLQTIAPKFTGRFNKGVDYTGDVEQFEREFNNDLAVLAHAVQRYGFPAELKLSVHSGSDKFSLYGPIRRALQRTGAGLHLKTAGTTWLEEIIGLAEAGGQGLKLAKEIYLQAFRQREELCAPYAAVIDINTAFLPLPEDVREWKSSEFLAALRHDPQNPSYNPNFRQLLHVSYKVAAALGNRLHEMLEGCGETIGRNVTQNLFERHIRRLFID
ncbi:tagaturonate epimerase family protein [Lignipirellula cremea]|uniref:Tagaturonate/fructuronate epimerase n=1 Tax=Lignipirellula cremea TaxID=2528010 RepID=A0A518DZ11_9BACT|nr:tagaturonate epimerase family protein [Lignipirellula cremea]QDU97064.1 hypothetical protein Pla8534_48900 [Lignipirellula cremea]